MIMIKQRDNDTFYVQIGVSGYLATEDELHLFIRKTKENTNFSNKEQLASRLFTRKVKKYEFDSD